VDATQYLVLVTSLAAQNSDSSEDTPTEVNTHAIFEVLLRALAPETTARPLAQLLLAQALSRSISDFRATCDHLIQMTSRLWQVPRIRIELYEAVLEAELRVVALPDMPPQKTCKRFEELLSLLSNDDPRKIDWWVRYVELAHRVQKWGGCSTGVPNTSDLHWRASRSIADQALFTERYQEVLQLLS